MKTRLLFFAFVFQVASSKSPDSYTDNRPTNPLWKSTSTDRLKQDLLLHYDKFARPMPHGNTTSVFMDITLNHIELDEKRSIMTVHCLVNMFWNDEKLKWNVSNYDGLNELHLADHEVWEPDIFPYNSASGSTIDHNGNTNLIAFSNGTVIWVPPSVFQVFCTLDFTKWPFDSQTCSLKVGSWTYNGEQIDLQSANNLKTIYEMSYLIPNAEWKFVKMEVQRNEVFYPCCPTPYVDITFELTVQRHSATYKALIITPASVIILITLAIFWLPPTSGDKVALGGVAVIITVLFILYFSQKMPAMAGQVPYIVTFYSQSLYLISFAIVISIIVINVSSNPKLSPLPWVLKKNLNGWLGKCLLIQIISDQQGTNLKAEEMDSQPVLSEQGRHISETNSKLYQKDWILLATAIDRIFFLVYSFAFVIMALMYSV